jgi:hypothetical protein
MRRLDIRALSLTPAILPVPSMTGANPSAVSSTGMPAIWAPQTIRALLPYLKHNRVFTDQEFAENAKNPGRSYLDVLCGPKYERSRRTLGCVRRWFEIRNLGRTQARWSVRRLAVYYGEATNADYNASESGSSSSALIRARNSAAGAP